MVRRGSSVHNCEVSRVSHTIYGYLGMGQYQTASDIAADIANRASLRPIAAINSYIFKAEVARPVFRALAILDTEIDQDFHVLLG